MAIFVKVENPLYDTYLSTDGETQIVTIIQASCDDEGEPLDINDNPAVVMMSKEGFMSLLQVARHFIDSEGNFIDMELPHGKH